MKIHLSLCAFLILLVSCYSLSDALYERDHKKVALLLEQGCDPNGFDPYYRYPIFTALSRNDIDLVIMLLDHGADINARLPDNRTPLFIAVMSHNEELVRILLERNADPYILTGDGMSPFLYVVAFESNQSHEMMNLFIEYGYDINNNDSLYTALTLAIMHYNETLVGYLLEKGADPNLTNRRGNTPMEEAMMIYSDIKRNAFYLYSPEGMTEACKKMTVIIDLLRQYGVKGGEWQ